MVQSPWIITLLGTASISFNTTGTIANMAVGILKGSGTVFGDLTNAGKVQPGSSLGRLTVFGAFSQQASGSVDVEVGGRGAGVSYDQFAINGAATLAETLNISLVNGFTAANGTVFQVVTFGSHAGDFATVNGLAQAGGVSFTKQTNATNVTLTAQIGPALAPDLSLAKRHTGGFTVGTNGVYTLTVENAGRGRRPGRSPSRTRCPPG